MDPEQLEWILDKAINLLLVLSHADAVVKAAMCSRDSLQHHLECVGGGRMQPNHLVKVRGGERVREGGKVGEGEEWEMCGL